jgi:hypothetical protein
MKSHLHRIPLFVLCIAFASAEPPGIDQSLEFVTPPTGKKFIRWHGKPGRTYFIMVSDPADHLKAWDFAPTIEGGNDLEISYEVDGTADKGFFRLLYTDEPTTDPYLADFDGDGISNSAEVEILHTNPFVANTGLDSDHDGIPDELEMYWYGNLTTMTATSDADGDGILDIYEAQAGSDPLVDQSADSAKRSNYEYDSMGRLTHADGYAFQSDVEGNLESSAVETP